MVALMKLHKGFLHSNSGKQRKDDVVRCPYTALLRACAQKKDLSRGIQLHADILKGGLLERNPYYIGSALVNMYAKCGALPKAREVLTELPLRNAVTWSALIAGYAEEGYGDEALDCYDKMQQEGLYPDAVTFTLVLKACGSIGAVDVGEQIHQEIVNQGLLQKSIALCNSLIDMYAKCGDLSKAESVLDELPVRNVVSWNALVAGYAQYGQESKAVSCLEHIRCEGHSPDAFTFACILKACGIIGAMDIGEQIHDEITITGLLETSIVLGNALLDMYVTLGLPIKAQHVLDKLSVRDIVSWSTLIAGYCQHEQGMEALSCFLQMQVEGLSADMVTYLSVLKACGSVGAVDKGNQIHDVIVKEGSLPKDSLIGTALVDMYVRCSAYSKAHCVLDELPVRDVITWNALIGGYMQQEQREKGVICLKRMQQEGLSPDAVTFTYILMACGNIGIAENGRQIHDEVVGQNLLGKDIVLGNALVAMYAKCGAILKAQQLLEELPVHNVVSWSALIISYCEKEQSKEALDCFEWMLEEGLCPDAVTYACVLKACGSIGALDKGRQIHCEIVKWGLLKKDLVLGNALVDMYAKCGVIAEAQWVMDKLSVRSVVTWNALIAGYAQIVQGEKALNCFEQMQCEGLLPDAVTVTCVLNACSRSGLVEDCQLCLASMITTYGITPRMMDYTCLVDLFGREGKFDKAVSVVKKMAPSNDPPIWSALLESCRKWGNVKLGRWAFERAFQTNRTGLDAYACASDICAAANMLVEMGKS